jgi:hypothetical protein
MVLVSAPGPTGEGVGDIVVGDVVGPAVPVGVGVGLACPPSAEPTEIYVVAKESP